MLSIATAFWPASHRNCLATSVSQAFLDGGISAGFRYLIGLSGRFSGAWPFGMISLVPDRRPDFFNLIFYGHI
jgi:hypothetical protein